MQDTATTETAATIDSKSANTKTQVNFETTLGNFSIQLNAEKAPVSVANFLQYVNDGFYDGTQFHRVIDGFMIQGGGFTKDLMQKPTRPAIQNEADNGLKNAVGSIAMARTGIPHSATSQFFINVNDNGFLNHTAKTPAGWGYAVFGHVTEGMEVINAIKAVETSTQNGRQNVPLEPVVINRAYAVN